MLDAIIEIESLRDKTDKESIEILLTVTKGFERVNIYDKNNIIVQSKKFTKLRESVKQIRSTLREKYDIKSRVKYEL